MIDELPSNSGQIGHHYMLAKKQKNGQSSPLIHAFYMQAIAKIMANSKYLIANNSNVSLWSVLNSHKSQEFIQLSLPAKNLSYFREKIKTNKNESLKRLLINRI